MDTSLFTDREAERRRERERERERDRRETEKGRRGSNDRGEDRSTTKLEVLVGTIVWAGGVLIFAYRVT